MRTFLKFAALTAAMILLLSTIQRARSGHTIYLLEWSDLDRLIWETLIDQLVAGFAVAALLARGPIQPGRSLGIALAVGLAGTALVGMATFTLSAELTIWSEEVGPPLALGLVMALAATRRWKLMWLAVAALLGALLRVTLLVLLALSM